ncbi:hypothetical protein ABZ372_47270, partial [Streptomyces sp. NPDC005921]
VQPHPLLRGHGPRRIGVELVPGVNVPAGFVGDGLPVGAQLLGPADSEPLLVSVAAQLEAALRWHEHWPPRAVPADSPAA